MIEDRIKILRRAAQMSSNKSDTNDFCIIAGNESLVDDIAYSAITAKDRVKILFRETVEIIEKYSIKKFDFIILKGHPLKIRELCNKCKENGGASVEITDKLAHSESKILALLGPEESMKSFVGESNRKNIKIDVLLEGHTVGFIKTELKNKTKIPTFLRDTITPILNLSDVILSILVITVKDSEDIEKVKIIGENKQLFGIDLKKALQNQPKKNKKE